MNKDFLNNTFDHFISCVDGRKLILFGSGDEMKRSITTFLDEHQLKIDYLIDNDFRLWYSKIYGYTVHEPKVLLDERSDEVVLLITSLYPFRIKEQLHRLGVHNYFSSILFVEEKIGWRQFLVRL